MRSKGHTLFFVFDGKPPSEKEREVTSRREVKEIAATQVAELTAFLESPTGKALDARDREHLELTLSRAQVEAWHMTRDARRAFQAQLWEEGIPYCKSVSEADDVLMDLIAAGKLDVILTTDMDYLLAGAATLWIPSRRGLTEMEEIRLEDVLEGEGLSREAFVDACLLCGTDERAGARGVPAHTAFAWMRHYGSLEALQRGNVTDYAFRTMFPGPESIVAARRSRSSSTEGPYARIRPDHLVRVEEFLRTL
jgi:flap endonuclease-1